MNVKQIVSGGRKYFVLVEGRDDIKQKIKLISVTDGQLAWEIQDVEYQGQLDGDSSEWWSATKQALNDQNLDKIQGIEAKQQNTDLVLEWKWKPNNSSTNQNEDVELRDRIVLQSCDAKNVNVRMLDVLTNSFNVVKEIQNRVDTELVYSKEMAKKLEQSEREKQELYQRFAVVLNEKKRQVRYFAEKAGMIDDKGIYQIQEDEKEDIPQENMVTDDKSKSGTISDDNDVDQEEEKEGTPVREVDDVEEIMNADTQPIPQQEEQDVTMQQPAEQQQQQPTWEKNDLDEKISPKAMKVVKKSTNKRGRRP
eukprot:TRINITY_DN1436_c0_g1_i3.p1 TRINITY_DN1436_c0_g1~~TRINITY_DN1436_c0_g1_i3.p1  ORF type:complete len:309 (+),score=69.14 TRINITY_DN1436_c0_g1_i3:115-1041(+)